MWSIAILIAKSLNFYTLILEKYICVVKSSVCRWIFPDSALQQKTQKIVSKKYKKNKLSTMTQT